MAASFDPLYEAVCTQPCSVIRLSVAKERTVTFKVVSTITEGRTFTSDLITVKIISPTICGTETLTANNLERFYVF